ncbi:3',5'-cyclic AMP phosphodiesterase CpdA [Nocardia tenerifensis]|uniref:3',5'-cyclic AMP phosphodiesterase CpdA n=1 Tax=Nocardia tenerifensis TaxID=228006 RepID=A0A318KED3_9NOCA|nr:metallophosphoesterase [Nocardia tenerifensis]PXX71295.1 3',5'-cyclic AMP phosphodiesterase CpdA [Nocardia tenerifensis]
MLDPRLRTAWLANVAAGAAAVTVRTPFYPGFVVLRTNSLRTQRNSLVASDLELVTVTDRTAILTWTTRARDHSGRWQPIPADTEVRIAPADSTAAPRPYLLESRSTPYHYAEITGLEPGRRYRFEAYSNGKRAMPARTLVTRRSGTPEATGVFTTATPPPGRLLRTIALANDVHYGEHTSGLVVGALPTGLRHDTAHYPAFMLDALLDDVRSPDRAADHLVLAGDLTDSGTLDQSRAVRTRLDSWGTLGRDYVVCRGNHDKPHRHRGTTIDHWGAVFHGRQRLVDYRVGELRLIGLDTTRLTGSGGTIVAPQRERLRELLAADPDRPTLVFGHHPVTSHAAVSNPAGPGFVLDPRNAAALHAMYRTAPGVFLHHSGHTHRNRLGRPDIGIDVEFLEVAAVKEYPGGYTLLRLYEGGYTANFYKTRSDAARGWSTRTRRQYLGLHPDHSLGSCADRNHVALRDFSGLTRSSPSPAR